MKPLVVVNILDKIGDITIPEKVPNWTDMDTQEKILSKIPRIHWPIMWFIAKEGVRPGEARALQWEDVDFKNAGPTL